MNVLLLLADFEIPPLAIYAVAAIVLIAMILGGMGPVDPLKNDAAKLFASAYALFSGLVAITVMGMVLAPLAHRALHMFHLEEEDPKS